MNRVWTRLRLVSLCLLAAAPLLATEAPDEVYFAAIEAGPAGDPTAAGEPLRAILATRPHLVRARRALAVVEDYQTGGIDSDTATLVLDGQGLLERQQWQEAETTLEAAVERAPDYHTAWHDLGRARDELGRARAAVTAYETALRLEPGYAYSLNNLGLAYWRLGEFEHALEVMRRAIAIEPAYCNAYNSLGWTLRALGRDDEARPILQKGRALCPGDAWLEANLAALPPASDAPGTREDETPARALVKRLTSRRSETRTQGAERLIQRRDAAVVPEILKLLHHRRDGVRYEAARVLAAYREVDLVGDLTRVAREDRSWLVRQEAVRGLSLLPAPTGLSTVIRSLTSDKAFQVRQAAVLALCARTDCLAAHALRTAHKDRSREARQAAQQCLARLGEGDPPQDPAALQDWVAGWCTDAAQVAP